MGQGKPITSEKQLLNLIENPDGKASRVIKARAERHRAPGFFSGARVRNTFFFLREKAKTAFSAAAFKGLIERNALNKALFFCALIAGSYAVADFSYLLNYADRMAELEVRRYEKGDIAFSPASVSGEKDEEYYLEKLAQRNIFTMGYKAKVEPEPEEPVAREVRYNAVPEILEMTKDLRLVGISWSENPDALIEDSKALRTFFVRQGGTIGKLTVEEITREKVVLSYKGERVDIK